MKNTLLAGLLALAAWLGAADRVRAQSTAFAYQGRLMSGGQPVNGTYDMIFLLFDSSSGGSQVYSANVLPGVVVTNGMFTVVLDFSGSFPGANRWLEVSVRPAGTGSYSTLSPRQRLTSTPYAITAANLSGGLPAAQLSGTVAAQQMGSFTNHNDVAVSGLAAGHALIFSGALWTNGSPATGGSAPAGLVQLSYSGTNVPVNASLGAHFRLVATNNFALQNPTGASDAQRLLFEIIQDSAGGRGMSLGNAFKLGTDISMVNLTTNANARDFLTCVCSGTNFYIVGLIKGY